MEVNIRKSSREHLIFAASIALIILGGVIAFGGIQNKQSITDSVLPEGSLTPVATGYILSESDPTRLRISKIGVDASFVDLGLAPNNEIEVPRSFEKVGWYIHGPTPGELGPAVILGHVDSYAGPAVLFYLGQLEPGDTIEVDREDGSTATFRVDKLERYPQSSFPTSLVYGDIDHSGLRLITCSGSYDRELQRYDHNLIVYASLIETEI